MSSLIIVGFFAKIYHFFKKILKFYVFGKNFDFFLLFANSALTWRFCCDKMKMQKQIYSERMKIYG